MCRSRYTLAEDLRSVDEYVWQRRTISGMRLIVDAAPGILGISIDADFVESMGVTSMLDKLLDAVCDFGGLSNDVFSFEKEIIAERTTANLVAQYYLTNADSTLPKAVLCAVNFVGGCFNSFLDLRREVEEVVSENRDNPAAHDLLMFLDWTFKLICSCWTWQFAGTARYLTDNSIWMRGQPR